MSVDLTLDKSLCLRSECTHGYFQSMCIPPTARLSSSTPVPLTLSALFLRSTFPDPQNTVTITRTGIKASCKVGLAGVLRYIERITYVSICTSMVIIQQHFLNSQRLLLSLHVRGLLVSTNNIKGIVLASKLSINDKVLQRLDLDSKGTIRNQASHPLPRTV